MKLKSKVKTPIGIAISIMFITMFFVGLIYFSLTASATSLTDYYGLAMGVGIFGCPTTLVYFFTREDAKHD